MAPLLFSQTDENVKMITYLSNPWLTRPYLSLKWKTLLKKLKSKWLMKIAYLYQLLRLLMTQMVEEFQDESLFGNLFEQNGEERGDKSQDYLKHKTV